jgi:hypothetical protein
MSEMLKWLACKLIDARISFTLGPRSDGKWEISVGHPDESHRMAVWIAEWKRVHEARA